jgi:phosphonoacetate hydrolase
MLQSVPGIEEVYPAEEAVKRFRLHPDRIGDIFILAARDTVFGELDQKEQSVSLRSHGSRHESDVPIIGYNSPWAADDFEYNVDVGRLFLASINASVR